MRPCAGESRTVFGLKMPKTIARTDRLTAQQYEAEQIYAGRAKRTAKMKYATNGNRTSFWWLWRLGRVTEKRPYTRLIFTDGE